MAWGENSSGQVGPGGAVQLLPVFIDGLRGAIEVAAGGAHSLALLANGEVWAWGSNQEGQLGDGTGVDQVNPVLVPVPFVHGAVSIAAGAAHSMAICDDGTTWAWGRNTDGQLGDGSTTQRDLPTVVRFDGENLEGLIKIAAGANHSLAIRDDGQLFTWGANASGQLGNGTWWSTGTPVRPPVQDVVSVAGGGEHSLALTANGEVFAWGANDWGQLGDGSFGNSSTPIRVGDSSFENVIAIAAGNTHSLALHANGSLSVWGERVPATLGFPDPEWLPGQVEYPWTAVAIAAGGRHLLAIDSTGTLLSWGTNGDGQLGDGTATDSSSTVTTMAWPGAGRIQARAGFDRMEAVRAEGTVWRWGDVLGQRTPAPQRVPELLEIKAVVSGGKHELALSADGRVWSRGNNSSGQLGDGTFVDRTSYVRIDLDQVIAIDAGETWSIALRADGTLWTWGDDRLGQLGVGTRAESAIPVDIQLRHVVAFSAGSNHGVAVLADGTVWTWGENSSGQLGDGTTSPSLLPQQIWVPRSAVDVAAGGAHTLALFQGGTVAAWGDGTFGQLGDGLRSPSAVPVWVNATEIVKVAAGTDHSLAIRSDGTGWAWGSNDDGRLGDESRDMRLEPVEIFHLDDVVDITGGTTFSAAVLGDASVVTWGDNSSGQLGDGTFVGRAVPGLWTPVDIRRQRYDLAAGDFHALGVGRSDEAWSWGLGVWGQLGRCSTPPTCIRAESPGRVDDLSGVATVAAGAEHSLATRFDGTVWSWGKNADGQLGDGTLTQRTSATRVWGIEQIVSVAAGRNHSIALQMGGKVFTWGKNASGQLGDGSTTRRESPVSVSSLSDIVAVAGGLDHSLALRSDGTVFAWGDNSRGQIGDGTLAPRLLPVAVGIPCVVSAISTNTDHSLALCSDGSVYGWGRNNDGQLGKGSISAYENVPVQVQNLAVAVTSISAGSDHSLAVLTDGNLVAWGGNGQHQLGDGSTTRRNQPVAVRFAPIASSSVTAGTLFSLASGQIGGVLAWGYNSSGMLGTGTTSSEFYPVSNGVP